MAKRPTPSESPHHEYPAAGTSWRIERASDAALAFALEFSALTESLSEWHQAFAAACDTESARRCWLVVRRLYGVAPLLTEDADELHGPWSVPDLANALGIVQPEIESLRTQAVAWWRKRQDEMLESEPEPESPAPLAATTPTPTEGVVGDDEIEQLLALASLQSVPSEHRQYAAHLMKRFLPYFHNVEAYTLARNLVRQELLLEQWHTRHDLMTEPHRAIDDKTYGTFINARNNLQSQIESSQKALQEIQLKTTGKKEAFSDSLGCLIEAMQAYYADGDNHLIDDIHTEAELEILLKPTTLRPVQYRPDVALMLREAMDNLWNPKYEAPRLQRSAVRILFRALEQAGLELVGEPINQEGIVTVEDGETVPEMPAPPPQTIVTTTPARAPDASVHAFG
jgi:hypothetical protein